MNLLASCARVLLSAVFVVLILATTAELFDATELMALCAIVGALCSVELLVGLAVTAARRRCAAQRSSGVARTSAVVAVAVLVFGGGLLTVRAFDVSAPSVETTWTSGDRTVHARHRRLPGQSVEQYIKEHVAAIVAAEEAGLHGQSQYDSD